MRLDRESVLRLIAEHGGPEGLDLSGRDLTGVDLSNIDLHGAILSKADLRNVDLRWADLRDVDMSWAVLQGSDLRWANCRGANLAQADMREVNMWGAELAETNLGGTDLSTASMSRVELTEGDPENVGTLSWVGRIGAWNPAASLSLRNVLIGAGIALALLYFWGWAYTASYYGAFNLPPSAVMDLLSADYLGRGGQVFALALKFLSAIPVILLYLCLFLVGLLVIPLAFLALGTRLFSFIPIRMARNIVFVAFLIIYLFVFIITMQYVVVPLWNAVFGSGIPFRDSFELFSGLWQVSGALVKLLMFLFVLLALIPLWLLYRWLARWVQRTEVSPNLAARFPNLARAWNGLQEGRLFTRSAPLTPRERSLGWVATAALLLAIPTFFAQAGAVKAQGDMCDGGDLPQITLFSNNMLESQGLGDVNTVEACLRLLAQHNARYFVFYPFQTRTEGGLRRAKVLQFPADTVFPLIHSETRACPTCAETENLPPAAVPIIVKATPTLVPTNTPPPTLTPLPTNTPLPTPTNTPPPTNTPLPSATPLPSNTPPPTATPPPFDVYEPDDLFEQAQFISVGETQTHNFNPEGDIDKVKFFAKAGRWYRITTDKLAPGVDTALILAANPGVIAQCDPPSCGATGQADDIAPGNLGSTVAVGAAADGIIYVTIVNKGVYGVDKTYTVRLEEFQPTPTLTPTFTPTETLEPTETPTITPTITPIPSNTPIPPTPTSTRTPTITPSALPSSTRAPTLTPSLTPNRQATPTIKPSPTLGAAAASTGAAKVADTEVPPTSAPPTTTAAEATPRPTSGAAP